MPATIKADLGLMGNKLVRILFIIHLYLHVVMMSCGKALRALAAVRREAGIDCTQISRPAYVVGHVRKSEDENRQLQVRFGYKPL